MVFLVAVSQLLGNTAVPPKSRTIVTASWTTDCPKIIFHILNEINEVPFGSGCLSSKSKVGGSVARANAAKVSCIKVTHSNWTAVNADDSSPLVIEDTNANPTAVTLTVSWNWEVSHNYCRNIPGETF